MSTTPGAEAINVGGKLHRSVREGSAVILAPYGESVSSIKKAKNNDEGNQAVFYNPIQQFNRDLSVLAILIYGEGAVIQKDDRFKKRAQSKTKRKEKLKEGKNVAPSNQDEPAIIAESKETLNLKKRKADELELEDDEEAVKRQRQSDFEADEEELAIMQLDGQVQAESERPGVSDSVEGTPKGQHHKDGVAHRASALLQSAKANNVKRGVPFTILDALSATGLRALRYAKEIPFATKIIANDLSPEAVKSIELNIDHNEVAGLVHSNVGDARSYMYSKTGNERQLVSESYIHKFDVIDLDPYGTAAPFFDAAIQALQDGGMLCVTCTDAGVFASVGYLEKTYDLYGGIPVKGAHSHEGGLRLILHAVATSAAKYGIAIEPLLSLSIDFYARLFIRVHKQQKDTKLLAGTTMIVYSCDHGCGSWSTQLLARNHVKEDRKGDLIFKYGFAQGPSVSQNCEHCGFKTHLGGPMWAGPLHNPHFIQRLLDRLPSLDRKIYGTVDRLEGMLTLALEEDLTLPPPGTYSDTNGNSNLDSKVIPRMAPETLDPSPFFFIPNFLAKVLHTTTPSEDQLRGALRHLGYRVTRSHCKPGSFRTNAPWSVLWEIFREWIRTKSPIKPDAVKTGTPGWEILAKLRGSERKAATDFRADLVAKMDKVDGLAEIKTILESAMYRLEHGSAVETLADGAGGVNGAAGAEEVEADEMRPPPAVRRGSELALETSKLDIVFDERLGKNKPREKLVRYQINPRANWGPMNRAGGS